MKEEIVKFIVARLRENTDQIQTNIYKDDDIKTRFLVIDNLLPVGIARKIFSAYPSFSEMRLLDSFREKKYTSKTLDKFNPLISDITFAFQDKRVIDEVSRIMDLRDTIGDPQLYAGGISAMAKEHFLNPHLDNSHDYEQKNYRVLNLL